MIYRIRVKVETADGGFAELGNHDYPIIPRVGDHIKHPSDKACILKVKEVLIGHILNSSGCIAGILCEMKPVKGVPNQ